MGQHSAARGLKKMGWQAGPACQRLRAAKGYGTSSPVGSSLIQRRAAVVHLGLASTGAGALMADRGVGLLTGDALDVGDRRRGWRWARLTMGIPFLLKRRYGVACTERSNSEGARPSRQLHGGSGGPLLRPDVDEGILLLLLLLPLLLLSSLSLFLHLYLLLLFCLLSSFFFCFLSSAPLTLFWSVQVRGVGCWLEEGEWGCELRGLEGGSSYSNGHGALCSSKLPSEALGWAGDT